MTVAPAVLESVSVPVLGGLPNKLDAFPEAGCGVANDAAVDDAGPTFPEYGGGGIKGDMLFVDDAADGPTGVVGIAAVVLFDVAPGVKYCGVGDPTAGAGACVYPIPPE